MNMIQGNNKKPKASASGSLRRQKDISTPGTDPRLNTGS